MEKQLGWAGKLGGAESQGISKTGQTVLARLMESQIWHQLAGSMGGAFRKGTIASAHLDARHFSFPLCVICAFRAATPVLELRGSKSEWVSLCVESFRGSAWGSRSFFHQLNSCWFLQPEIVGTYLPGPGTLGWGFCCGVGTPCSRIFIHHMSVWDQHIVQLCPSYQSRWMWFL